MTPRQSQGWLVVALGLTMAMASAALADSVTLKTGKVLEGRILSETPEAVAIDVEGMTLTIARNKIASIDKSVAKAPDAATTGPAAIERLEALELEGRWPELYEAAAAVLRADPTHAIAAKKKTLAEGKIRDALGGKRVDDLVRERRFDEAIAFLTERLRLSERKGREVEAVGRRALAAIHLEHAEARMRTSLDGHVPLAEARKARELDPTAPRLDCVEGMAQMKLHHFEEAAALLERAARADPENFGIRLPLMQCYDYLGRHEKIVATLEAAPVEARASADRWPEVRDVAARAYLRVALEAADRGTTPPAAAAYEKYLSFTERTPDHLRDAIRFFEHVGDRQRAQAIRDERLRGTPTGGAAPEDSPP